MTKNSLYSLRLQFLLCACFCIFMSNNVFSQGNILKNEHHSFSVNLKNLEIALIRKGKTIPIASGELNSVSNFIAGNNQLSWETLHHKIKVSIANEYLEVAFESKDTTGFVFPKITENTKAFIMPFHEGKYIPSDDKTWIKQLTQEKHETLQEFSMSFFSVYQEDFASTFILENQYNNSLSFSESNNKLTLSLLHEQPIMTKNKTFSYRIYISKPTVGTVATIYKNYIKEKGKFKSFDEKQQRNPSIEKLFGAPHIYVWNNELLTTKSINDWKVFVKFLSQEIKSAKQNTTKSIVEKIKTDPESKDWLAVWNKLDQPVYDYEKKVLLQSINYLVNKKTITREELVKAYGSFINNDLGDGNSVYLMNELHNNGIKKAWIGLSDWEGGIIVPEFTKKAVDLGYLVAPYDSYHSIHPTNNIRWRTARFEDESLYEIATVLNKKGKKETGFLGFGRKLNPLYTQAEVAFRLDMITKQVPYNSWFIDADAYGESFDDYTTGRMSSQADDVEARLKRMSYIRDNYNMVVGSEVGIDFSATTIAYAHGMLTPSIWGDQEMRKDKNSPYYVGAYYSSTNSIPSIYNKEVDLKPIYTYLNYDMRFNIPLYQLVYNNSVIATHHWEWGTLKVKKEVRNNELKEILYNVPPLYHLNREEWTKNKDRIIKHVKEFASLHEKLIKMEMVDFTWLSEDQLVQKTSFKSKEETVVVVVNFSNQPYDLNGVIVEPKSHLVILN